MRPLSLLGSLEGSLIPWCSKDVAAGAVYALFFLVNENKRETKEKGETTIRQGLPSVKPQGWVLQ